MTISVASARRTLLLLRATAIPKPIESLFIPLGVGRELTRLTNGHV